MNKCLLFSAALAVAACGDNVSAALAPEVASARLSIAVDEGGTTTVEAAAVDPQGMPLTYAASTPAHGTVTGTGPVFSYVPEAGYHGTDSFTIRVSNGVTSVEVRVAIAVNHVNAPPVAEDQQATSNQGQPVAIALIASDSDSPTLTFAIDAPPAHGTLMGALPNVIYTPDVRYSGSDAFTFEVSDGSLTSNVATVTLTVSAAPCFNGVAQDAPAAALPCVN